MSDQGRVEVGDWIQVTNEISEEDFMGEALWIHARAGGIGHVLEVLPDGFVTAFFERSGTQSLTHESEFKKLCNADGSKVKSLINDH